MRQKKYGAFTLVELIVVITILAILGTLAFISLRGFSKDARNSARISDMKTIARGLDLYFQKYETYPLPDEMQTLTYSGTIAWQQGVFGSGVLSAVQRVSNIPVDPITGNRYSYAVLGNARKYQLAGAFEGGFFTLSPILVSQTYAFTNNEFKGHTFGNFTTPNIMLRHDTTCSLFTSPSIILSDFPSGNILVENENYNYSYIGSAHIPASYSGSVTPGNPQSGFPFTKVFSGCTMETMDDLNLYIAKLSTAYQPLAFLDTYSSLVYESHTQEYKKQALKNLEELGIGINSELKNEVNAPPPERIFGDTFDGIDGIPIVGTYIPSSGTGNWDIIPGGNASSYQLYGNNLRKIDNSHTLLFPNTSPSITLANYESSFDIQEFAGGYIEVYLRYVDTDNYYRLRLSPGSYEISRRLGGIDSIFNSISDGDIILGATIHFSISGDSVILNVNGNEKENIVAGGIADIGKNIIYLQNTGAEIDNFTFTYQ